MLYFHNLAYRCFILSAYNNLLLCHPKMSFYKSKVIPFCHLSKLRNYCLPKGCTNGDLFMKLEYIFTPSYSPQIPLSLSPSASHNDLPLRLRILHDNRLSQVDLRNISKVSTDISRLQAGHVGAQVASYSSFTPVRRLC